jgi:SAM-dependent methyltransferase
LRLLPEVLVTPRAPGELLVWNPFVRMYAIADAAFVELLSRLAGPDDAPELGDGLAGQRFRAREVTKSPFTEGLLGDPTGLDRAARLADAPALDLDEALALARRLMLVVDDEDAYERHLAPRKNVLDRARRGDLHQRVGEYVLLDLRLRDLDAWWADQKFTPDRRELRAGPYRDVQRPFVDRCFGRERLEGRRVLDFGCGPGLFARLFASRGATVVGLDTSVGHLETASQLAADDGLGEATTFLPLELPAERALKAFEDESFDLVFLSDVLMFYFHPYGGATGLDPTALLAALLRLLAPGGFIAVLEPNGSFWQQPWLGAPGRPFTVLTEYRQRRYGVTPTLEQVAVATENAGLCITRIRELAPDPAPDGGPEPFGDSWDMARARGFAAEFPLWWYFELQRAP